MVSLSFAMQLLLLVVSWETSLTTRDRNSSCVSINFLSCVKLHEIPQLILSFFSRKTKNINSLSTIIVSYENCSDSKSHLLRTQFRFSIKLCAVFCSSKRSFLSTQLQKLMKKSLSEHIMHSCITASWLQTDIIEGPE